MWQAHTKIRISEGKKRIWIFAIAIITKRTSYTQTYFSYFLSSCLMCWTGAFFHKFFSIHFYFVAKHSKTKIPSKTFHCVVIAHRLSCASFSGRFTFSLFLCIFSSSMSFVFPAPLTHTAYHFKRIPNILRITWAISNKPNIEYFIVLFVQSTKYRETAAKKWRKKKK